MGKIVSMTLSELREYAAKHKKIAADMAKTAPFYDGDPNPGGVVVARGFAQFKEYINKNGRPKSDDPRVVISIRVPASDAKTLRATGPGWQTRASEYLVRGIKRGAIGAPAA